MDQKIVVVIVLRILSNLTSDSLSVCFLDICFFLTVCSGLRQNLSSEQIREDKVMKIKDQLRFLPSYCSFESVTHFHNFYIRKLDHPK